MSNTAGSSLLREQTLTSRKATRSSLDQSSLRKPSGPRQPKKARQYSVGSSWAEPLSPASYGFSIPFLTDNLTSDGVAADPKTSSSAPQMVPQSLPRLQAPSRASSRGSTASRGQSPRTPPDDMLLESFPYPPHVAHQVPPRSSSIAPSLRNPTPILRIHVDPSSPQVDGDILYGDWRQMIDEFIHDDHLLSSPQ